MRSPGLHAPLTAIRAEVRLSEPSHNDKVRHMASNLYDEIVKLDAATRLQLAQDLLDSVASETFATSLTREHRSELQARLAHHQAHPDEPTFTLAEIKARAGIK